MCVKFRSVVDCNILLYFLCILYILYVATYLCTLGTSHTHHIYIMPNMYCRNLFKTIPITEFQIIFTLTLNPVVQYTSKLKKQKNAKITITIYIFIQYLFFDFLGTFYC